MHSIIDDHSLIASARRPEGRTVTSLVARALDALATPGITDVKRLQTDNARAYIHNRSLHQLLADRGIQHRRIPPRTPKRNGTIERYQQPGVDPVSWTPERFRRSAFFAAENGTR